MEGCASCFTVTADREQQRRHRCPVIPQSEWGPPDQEGLPYMGGEGQHGESDCDGCPGSWYRTPYMGSVERYRRNAQGQSPHLDRTTDRLVIDAVLYYEQESTRHSETL